MHKNTYLDLVLTVCMGVVQESLWAKVKPAPEHSANIRCTCAMTLIEPSEQKLEQKEQKEKQKEEHIMEEMEPGKAPAK